MTTRTLSLVSWQSLHSLVLGLCVGGLVGSTASWRVSLPFAALSVWFARQARLQRKAEASDIALWLSIGICTVAASVGVSFVGLAGRTLAAARRGLTANA
eukprot:Rhum_TRINITY_DN12745_c2_g1::Rhum_TRINITY_DN12745_c2_g1_i1::g.54090::m.54090